MQVDVSLCSVMLANKGVVGRLIHPERVHMGTILEPCTNTFAAQIRLSRPATCALNRPCFCDPNSWITETAFMVDAAWACCLWSNALQVSTLPALSTSCPQLAAMHHSGLAHSLSLLMGSSTSAPPQGIVEHGPRASQLQVLCSSHRVCSCALKVFSSLRRLVFLKAPLASSLGLGAGAGADACSPSLSSCTTSISQSSALFRLA